MTPNLLFYQLLVVALVLLCLVIHVWWPADSKATVQPLLKPTKPCCKRSKVLKLFTGMRHKPLCEACE